MLVQLPVRDNGLKLQLVFFSLPLALLSRSKKIVAVRVLPQAPMLPYKRYERFSMQRWVSFILLLAFIRLQLVCCCGSVGICCETASPGIQESMRVANALLTCPCDHDHHVGDVSDASHLKSDSQELSDESQVEWEIASHDGTTHSQSHCFYLSEQNQSVLAKRADFKNISQPIAYFVLWSTLDNQKTDIVIECCRQPKYQPSVFDLVRHLRI